MSDELAGVRAATKPHVEVHCQRCASSDAVMVQVRQNDDAIDREVAWLLVQELGPCGHTEDAGICGECLWTRHEHWKEQAGE